MSQTTDWGMVGAFIGAITFCATLITLGMVAYDVFRPERRKRKLGTPGVSFFIVPSVEHHECSYAHQDEQEHRVNQISLPPYSQTIIDLIIIPNLDFTTNQVIFACEAIARNERLAHRPQLTEVYNRFIKIGPRRNVLPSDSDNKYDDYIDKYNSYHMVEDWRWSVETTRAIGFKIKTNNPGRFKLSMFFTGEMIEGNISDIMITVKEVSHADVLYCIDERHRHLHCAAGIMPKG